MSSDQWRWTDEQGVQRLLDGNELRSALADGRLRPSVLVWRRGMANWVPAQNVPELVDGVDLTPRGDARSDLAVGEPTAPTPSIPPLAGEPSDFPDRGTMLGIGERGQARRKHPLATRDDSLQDEPTEEREKTTKRETNPYSSIDASALVPTPQPLAEASPAAQRKGYLSGRGLGGKGFARKPLKAKTSSMRPPPRRPPPGSRSQPPPAANRPRAPKPRSIPPPPKPRAIESPVDSGEVLSESLFPSSPGAKKRGKDSRPQKPSYRGKNRPQAPRASRRGAEGSGPGETTLAGGFRREPPPVKRSAPGPKKGVAPPPPSSDEGLSSPFSAPSAKKRAEKSSSRPLPPRARPLPPSRSQSPPPVPEARVSLVSLTEDEDSEEATAVRDREAPNGEAHGVAPVEEVAASETPSDLPQASAPPPAASPGPPAPRASGAPPAPTTTSTPPPAGDDEDIEPPPGSLDLLAQEALASRPPVGASLAAKSSSVSVQVPGPAPLPSGEGLDAISEALDSLFPGGEKSTSTAPSSLAASRAHSIVPGDPSLEARSGGGVTRKALGVAAVVCVLGVAGAFGAGRVSAPEAVKAKPVKTGLQGLPLLARAAEAETDVRPCLMTRAPSRFAPSAYNRVPFSVAPLTETTIAVGYARTDVDPGGLSLDPQTGKASVVHRGRGKRGQTLSRVVPLVGSEPPFGATALEAQGLRQSLWVPSQPPFVLGFEKTGLARRASPEGDSVSLWPVEGRADALKTFVLPGKPTLVTYRASNKVFFGSVAADGSVAQKAVALPGSGGTVGKPDVAVSGDRVSVVFADRPTAKGAGFEIRWARGTLGEPLTDVPVLEVPPGGPGGNAGAPAIAPLPGGRWLLMWSEGGRGRPFAIRAQTYDRNYRPIGTALRVSPETGSFGQGTIAVLDERAVMLFLLDTGDGYEIWGTVLQCG